jgi:glycosyltransferase involved in cell wall biosynthesis
MEKSKNEILFITSQLPYPPVSGGTIKSFKLIEFLSQNYNLHLATLLKGEEDIKNEKIFLDIFSNRLVTYKSFPINSKRFSRNISNLVKSYIKNKPFAVFRNSNEEMENYVRKLVSSIKIDYIIVDHFLSFQFIEPSFNLIKDKDIKILLHEHNAEYIIWRRHATIDKNLLRKIILFIESKRVEAYEKKICHISDKILCVSTNDIENLKNIGIPSNKLFLVMSLGDERLLFKEDLKYEDSERALLFIGTLSWEPNAEGLIWFIKKGWNPLKNLFPDLKLYIVGKNAPDRLVRIVKDYEDIILTGFVEDEDLEIYYKKCRVFISPIGSGSGIKIKNINAMYRGIPVVTTPIGAEGIRGADGIHYFIADDIHEFTKKITILLTDKDIWNRLSKNSRELMRKYYTWDATLRNLRELLEEEE